MQQKNNKAYMYSMKAACGQKRQSVLDPVFRMWDVSRFKSRLCNMLLPWTNLTLNSGVRVSHCASVISSEVFHAAEQEANEANFFRGWVTLPPKLAAIWNDTKNVSELLTVCSRPKAYYAMYLSKYATLTSQTSYTAVTPSNPFCELIINALGRPPLEALNRESKPLQSQTIWRGPASLCCIEIILFWRIWMVIS